MNPKYLNLSFNDFLSAITYEKNRFCLRFGEDELVGELSEMKDFVNKLENLELRDKLLSQLENKSEYIVDFELSVIEIYNYLEIITNKFNPIKTNIALNDIETYHDMVFQERIIQKSIVEYKNNGWEIPRIIVTSQLHTTDLFGEKGIEINDHKTMLKKTHPFDGLFIDFAIDLLKEKLKSKPKPKQDNTNPYPQIFKEQKYFELFEDFRETIKEEHQLAGYSFIFNEMHQDGYIYDTVRPSDFTKFLSNEFDVHIDKLRPYNYNRTSDKENLYATLKRQLKSNSIQKK